MARLGKSRKSSLIVNYAVHDVFTPTRPARINYVERTGITTLLFDALRTPGKQVIVYGESGSGKSTLLRNTLLTVYEDHIVTQCTADMSYEQLLLNAFDQLNPFYVEHKTTSKGRSVSPAIAADFKAIKVGIDTSFTRLSSEVAHRLLPPQLTAQRLAVFLGELGMCWVIEDFHKIRDTEKTLYAQCLKVFSDMSDTYREVKTITVGATETARQVVHYEAEMTRRVSELVVPLMTAEEVREIIVNGQELLNLDMNPIMDDVVDYSVGMPSVCHQIALNACLERGIEVTLPERMFIARDDLQPAVNRWVSELSDTIKSSFELALRRATRAKYDNAKIILTALAAGPVAGMLFDEIFSRVRQDAPKYPKSNLSLYLRELCLATHGALLRFGTDGKYRFTEPVYHTAAKAMLIDLSSRAEDHDASDFLHYTFMEQAVVNKFYGLVSTEPLSWNFFPTFTLSDMPVTYDALSTVTVLPDVTGQSPPAKREFYVSPRRRVRGRDSDNQGLPESGDDASSR